MQDEIDLLKLENRVHATPLGLLKQGLVRKQWEAVSLAYMMLTGEKIEVEYEPVEIVNANAYAEHVIKNGRSEDTYREPEDKDEEIFIDNEPEPEEDEDEESPKSTRGSKTLARRAKIETRDRKNKYIDKQIVAMEDISFLPKNKEIIKELETKRPPAAKIAVVCKECGKREKIDPSLGPVRLDKSYRTRYLCNQCAIGPGGR
jgi:hypothetical protein